MSDKKTEIIRSNRKTLSIEIKKDFRIIVRAPYWTSNKTIECFLSEKSDWIEKKIKILTELSAQKSTEKEQKYTAEQLLAFKEKATEIIPLRTQQFAAAMGVDFKKITIRRQRTRWGSCSAEGNLNFNCLLVLCPDEIINYVIVHELCHRKQLNHSKAFWKEVEQYMPQYKQAQLWLKQHGASLIQKLSH